MAYVIDFAGVKSTQYGQATFFACFQAAAYVSSFAAGDVTIERTLRTYSGYPTTMEGVADFLLGDAHEDVDGNWATQGSGTAGGAALRVIGGKTTRYGRVQFVRGLVFVPLDCHIGGTTRYGRHKFIKDAT